VGGGGGRGGGGRGEETSVWAAKVATVGIPWGAGRRNITSSSDAEEREGGNQEGAVVPMLRHCIDEGGGG